MMTLFTIGPRPVSSSFGVDEKMGTEALGYFKGLDRLDGVILDQFFSTSSPKKQFFCLLMHRFLCIIEFIPRCKQRGIQI
jgi:hypothetical protein